MDAFQMIDKNKKGYVTGPELSDALTDLGSRPLKEELYLFVRRYDKDSDGRLLFSDFGEAFNPKDSLAAAALSRRTSYQA